MSSSNQTLIDTIINSIPPLHRDGWKFVVIFAAGALLLHALIPQLAWFGWIATLWCAYFFRDPVRMVPTRIGLIVSPADGKVQKLAQVKPPAELEMGEAPRTRISIFLNVFDVHVNRVPVEGTISKLHYHKGTFVNAALDKASEDNERQLVKVTLPNQKDVGFVQIAGLVARRIVCTLQEGQMVKTGERYGLIRFGSRVDVYLPEGAHPLVIEGQYMLGGETVLADLASSEPARVGEGQ